MTSSPPTVPGAKRSWPLLLLAGCAFLPGFGFFFGAAAVTWGLVSDRPRAMRAVIIGGLGAILNLVGGAVLMWRVQDAPAYTEFNIATQKDLARLISALEDYRAGSGAYPAELTVFSQLPLSLKFVNVQDHSVGVFSLPRLYQYHRTADGENYDLFAVGPDGEAGTADDIRPELPDSVAQRSGYLPSR